MVVLEVSYYQEFYEPDRKLVYEAGGFQLSWK
jgi:hypothetical protein